MSDLPKAKKRATILPFTVSRLEKWAKDGGGESRKPLIYRDSTTPGLIFLVRGENKTGDGRNRKLLGKSQYQGIHEQGETTPRARPGDFNLSDLVAMPTIHTRQGSVQKGLVLKKNGDAAKCVGFDHESADQTQSRQDTPSAWLHRKDQNGLSLPGLKANVRDFPRLLEAQRCSEECCRFHVITGSVMTHKSDQDMLFSTRNGRAPSRASL